MADRFMSRISVTGLAAGASTTLAHNIVVGDVATAPQIVLADRGTTIRVDTVTATQVTFTNSGPSTATAVFWAWFHHSITAVPGDTSPGIFYKGTDSGGAVDTFVAPNEYFVSTTATASADRRIYNTVAAAVAAAVTAGVPFVIRLQEGQAHTWDGTGWTGTVDGTITSMGDILATLTLSVGAIAGAGSLTFSRVALTHTGTVTASACGTLRFLG